MEYMVIKKMPEKFSEKGGTYVDRLSPYQFIVKYVREGGVYAKKAICNVQDLKKLKMEGNTVYITEKAEKLLLEANRVPITQDSECEKDSAFDMFDIKKDLLVNFEQIKVAIMKLQGWT